MYWGLEVIVVPVSDVDASIEFYQRGMGFGLDHDLTMGDQRITQLTPPGSGCSIVLRAEAEPRPLNGLQLVVPDLRAAQAELRGRGIDPGEIQVLGENPNPVPDPLDNAGFLFLADPDGHSWAIQQISTRG